MKKVLLAVVLGGLLIHVASGFEYAHTIHINPSIGQDTSECLISLSPCANLTWVLKNSRQDSTNYVLSQGNHTLTESSPQFKNLKHLAFTGNNSLVICIQTGLAFVNVENIVFQDITFSGCAALRNSTSKNFANDTISESMVGLYFYLCESIGMSGVSVTHSPNATGVVIYNTNGTNTFSRSNFTDNGVAQVDKDKVEGGGGVYIEFTYCPPGVLSCEESANQRNTNASYTFESCVFRNNQADSGNSRFSVIHTVPYHSDHLAFGHGGGLAVFFKGSASANAVSLLNCKFENNVARFGGGMLAHFHDSSHSNVVNVSGCDFTANYCPYSMVEGLEGGGMRVGHYVYGLYDVLPPEATRNRIVIEKTAFRNNSAMYGGGLNLAITLQQASRNQTASVYLFKNTFDSNTAKIGSAVNIDRFDNILTGSVADVQVEDCLFINNSVHYAEIINQEKYPYQMGIGAVHIDEIPVWFKGNITFLGNTGSALAITGTTANFTHCHAHFSENAGDRGAAIALLGSAYLQISSGTWMSFEHNSAITRGGAIYNTYVSRKNIRHDTNCFIRHTNPLLHPDDWNATFIFASNTDLRGGHNNSIHSTSILPCFAPGGSGVANSTAHIFCWRNWFYGSDIAECDANRTITEVTSDIGRMTFFNDSNFINVYSGWTFTLPIVVEDDLNHGIEKLPFQITYSDSNLVNVYRVDNINVRGKPYEPMKITVDSLGNRVWHFDLNVNLEPCPAGFMIKNTTMLTTPAQCVCSGSYSGTVLCDDVSKTIQLLNGMWIGKINDSLSPYQGFSDYVVMDCPIEFCTKSDSKYTNVTYSNDPDKPVNWDFIICGPANRTGISCGECIEGYGPAVNSMTYECVNCTSINLAANIVIYIASVYLPLAALFTVLIIFDIRLTTGPANAFILYCQMVTETFDLNSYGDLSNMSKARYVYRFPFGIFNLKLIENYLPPICLSPRFNVLTILLLDYAIALFPLLMIIVAIVCLRVSESCCFRNQHISVNHRRRLLSVSRFIGVFSGGDRRSAISDALLPAFASFLLLSYTKFSATTFNILNGQSAIDDSGNEVGSSRIYYAPQMTYTDPSYQLYYIPAILVLATIVVFTPLILLDYPLRALEWCIMRVACLKRIYPNDKIHLFLNLFQGCYRTKMRFFAGLYFLFRFAVNVAHILTINWLQQLFVQQLAVIVMILLLVLCRPYEWMFLNYIDTIMFIILAVLNSVAFYLYSYTIIFPEKVFPLGPIVLQYFLVFLPLVYMVGFILWRMTQPHHSKVKLMLKNLAKKGTSDEEFSDESMFSRAEGQNTYSKLSGSQSINDDGDTFVPENTPLLSPFEGSSVSADTATKTHPEPPKILHSAATY